MAVLPLSEANSNLFNTLIAHHIQFTIAKRRVDLTSHDWYRATALVVRDILTEKMLATDLRFEQSKAKKLYYLSLEFLIGRSLENNLINLGIIDTCRGFLAANGVDLQVLLDEEPDAALGNGGLGRLAACFLDSLATLDLPGYAYGINYEFGLFRQEIHDGYQVERPDAWQRETSPWLLARPEELLRIPVYGRVEQRIDSTGEYAPAWVDQRVIVGVPSDLPIAGFGGRTVNFVRLYSAHASDEFDMQIFNAGDYLKAVEQKMLSETISKVLYPSDAMAAGRELRLLQEYFFVACAVRDILHSFLAGGGKLAELPSRVAIQLNDTHPSLTIAELMRTFVDDHDLPWAAAWEITRSAIAYTNHTLMPEALERWPAGLLERVVPRHLQIIYEINRRFLADAAEMWPDDPERLKRVSIVQDGSESQIRMAHLAIIGSHSVNGVSKLHSELVRTRLAPDFYQMWPARFSNKTNGVTQRRWLLMANPDLASLLDASIGEGWETDLSQVSAAEEFACDREFQQNFAAIKRANKERLAGVVNEIAGVDFDPAAIFDIQAKRIHEYKRQLLMALGIVHQYLRIVDDGAELAAPRAYVFAGKAAPGYWTAKMIIKLINNLGQVINRDPKTRGMLKVAFLPDYRVSLAERIIPAADVSEQISTAGREASGTGNMKFAMNGALTIGTLDGANIEIREAVGDGNIFIFGLTAEQIESMTARNEYRPRDYYDSEPRLKRVLDELASDRFCPGEPGLFRWIRDTLLSRDEYFLMADFASYIDTQSEISRQYQDRQLWTRKAILNLARIGKFSSDRAVAEYARDIWRITPA
ncbi:MAG: glycogen/starch/alpha-glucan phosphorylase [Candidatus Binataceae bacterium]